MQRKLNLFDVVWFSLSFSKKFLAILILRVWIHSPYILSQWCLFFALESSLYFIYVGKHIHSIKWLCSISFVLSSNWLFSVWIHFGTFFLLLFIMFVTNFTYWQLLFTQEKPRIGRAEGKNESLFFLHDNEKQIGAQSEFICFFACSIPG